MSKEEKEIEFVPTQMKDRDEKYIGGWSTAYEIGPTLGTSFGVAGIMKSDLCFGDIVLKVSGVGLCNKEAQEFTDWLTNKLNHGYAGKPKIGEAWIYKKIDNLKFRIVCLANEGGDLEQVIYKSEEGKDILSLPLDEWHNKMRREVC